MVSSAPTCWCCNIACVARRSPLRTTSRNASRSAHCSWHTSQTRTGSTYPSESTGLPTNEQHEWYPSLRHRTGTHMGEPTSDCRQMDTGTHGRVSPARRVTTGHGGGALTVISSCSSGKRCCRRSGSDGDEVQTKNLRDNAHMLWPNCPGPARRHGHEMSSRRQLQRARIMFRRWGGTHPSRPVRRRVHSHRGHLRPLPLPPSAIQWWWFSYPTSPPSHSHSHSGPPVQDALHSMQRQLQVAVYQKNSKFVDTSSWVLVFFFFATSLSLLSQPSVTRVFVVLVGV